MQHKRDPLTATLFSVFIPFYIIYWFYDTAKKLKANGQQVPSIALLFAPFIMFIVFIFIIIGATASNSPEGAGASLILVFLGFPLAMVLQLMYMYKFSKAVNAATSGQAGTGLLFVLYWFVAPAGVFIAQEKLNETSGVTPTAPAPASPQPTQPPASQAPRSQENSQPTIPPTEPKV